jgi:hypothetical protein
MSEERMREIEALLQYCVNMKYQIAEPNWGRERLQKKKSELHGVIF